ncbi:MAG: RNA-directed DNA polymerase [Clostridia bacterium]|nr:RNA-directed DNA polymerase [Clostridia bacterium]
MNFLTYEQKFKEQAELSGKSEYYIDECLNYARNLNKNGLPIIYDDVHLSKLLGIRLDFLISISNSQKDYYRFFSISKSNGKSRKIAEPLPLLKEIQHFILDNILLKVPCSVYSKAYKPGAKLKSNAKFHRNQPVLIKMDLKDYFPSLDEHRVYKFFHHLGYKDSVSVLLAKLCTLNKALPQGAPTSPYLSNLLTRELDEDIYLFCKENGNLRYTRYADDISISGNMIPTNIIKGVVKIIAKHGLKINKEKTAVIPNSNRQVVTGVVVNQKLQASKPYRHSIRLEMHYCMRYGIEDHIKKSKKISNNTNKRKYCQQMLGKVNHCLQLNPNDSEMKSYRDFLLQKIVE